MSFFLTATVSIFISKNMSCVINHIPTFSFTENFPDILVSGVTAPIHITVALEGARFIDNMELNSDTRGIVTVPMRQILSMLRTAARPEAISTKLPRIDIHIECGENTSEFSAHVMPGGLADVVDNIEGFTEKNFLTWQPQILWTTRQRPQWLALIQSTDSRIEIRTTLTCTDGRTFTRSIVSHPAPLIYHQIDVSFATLWAEFCENHSLCPYCYDIEGGVIISGTEGITPTFLPYKGMVQRYMLREPSLGDILFGFVNTLGGLDVLVMQGQQILKPQGKISTFIHNNSELELANSYTSYWEVSTGYIDSENTAAQYRDFMKSRDRWIYSNGIWSRIIVDEFTVEDTRFELNAYSFKYHLAERNERRFFERTDLPEVELPIIL